MSTRHDSEQTRLRLIDGGLRPGVVASVPLQLPAAPRMGPGELAAELAELYAHGAGAGICPLR